MADEIKGIVPLEVTEETIKSKIYLIRGQRVMLDSDLAVIYGYATKDFNRQVRNNIEKFQPDFMFRLSKNEVEDLRCKNSTANISPMSRSLPYVFTEQGIYMLMTVLKGELATRQSIALIRTFKAMKDYIIENRDLLGAKEILQLSVQTQKNTIAIDYGERSEAVYHCGASSKDAGIKTTTISRLEDISVYHQVFDSLLKNPPLTI